MRNNIEQWISLGYGHIIPGRLVVQCIFIIWTVQRDESDYDDDEYTICIFIDMNIWYSSLC